MKTITFQLPRTLWGRARRCGTRNSQEDDEVLAPAVAAGMAQLEADEVLDELERKRPGG